MLVEWPDFSFTSPRSPVACPTNGRRANYGGAGDARDAGEGGDAAGAGRRRQSARGSELSGGMGMEPAGLDWREIRGARSGDGLAASRSCRVAAGAEVRGGEPVAHREVD